MASRSGVLAGAVTRRDAALVALLALCVFLPSLRAGYVYDDLLLVAENPFVHGLGHLGRAFRTNFWDVGSDGLVGNVLRYYRPIATASYAVNWAALGGSAWGFHLVNVLLHAATTYLVVRLATRWTGDRQFGLAAGIVFALHPTRTESVIWISGRTDLLMTFFALASVEAAHRGVRSAGSHRALAFAGALALAVGAVLSKETGILVAPLIAADALVAPQDSPERRDGLRLAGTFGAEGLLYALGRSVVFPLNPHGGFAPTPRYGFFTAWAYVERAFFPWPQTSFYRPLEMTSSGPLIPAPFVVLGVVVVLGAVALGMYAFQRDRAAFALLATAVASLAPVLNFVHTGILFTTADRFLYFPLFAALAGLARLYRDRLGIAAARPVLVVFGAACLVYAGVDVRRSFDFETEDAFWRHELAVNPDNPLALTNLSDEAARSGDLTNAKRLIEKAVSPESTRFFALAGDRTLRAAREGRRLSLDAALVADGEVKALETDFAALDRLLVTARTPEGTAKDSTGVLAALRTNAPLAAIAADAALVGTRVGRVSRANQLSRAIASTLFFRLSNPLNLVLVRARLGDFAGARKLLALAEHPPSGTAVLATPDQARDLTARLDRAERSFVDAARSPERRARVEAATALAELGAYLAALRVLRPLFDTNPSEVGPLYVQLLVSARLDKEAMAIATHLLGPDRAPAVIARIRSGLPPRLLALPPPPEPSPWWPPS